MGLFQKKITYLTTGDDFRVYEGKTDISDSIEGLSWFRSDHMLAYCDDTHRTLLLYNMKDCEPGRPFPGEVVGEVDTLLFVRSEDRMFELYYRGIAVTERVVFCDIDDDLWFYDPVEENTFLLRSYETVGPNVFAETQHVGTRATDAFCYRIDKTRFRVVYQGTEYTDSFKGTSNDPHILVYIPADERMFVFRNALTMKMTEWAEDEYSVGGTTPIFWKTGDTSFFVFYQGRDVTASIGAFKMGSSTVLYFEETNSHYWVDDGWSLEAGSYRAASLFAENCSAVWHGNGRELHVYYKGKRITDEIQLQRVGDNGIAMHEPTMTMFQLEDMVHRTDNVLRGIPE